MRALLRLVLNVALSTWAIALWLMLNRQWFGFDPLAATAWQQAAEAFTGVAGFDPLSGLSWRQAAELAGNGSRDRFGSAWVIDDAREAGWVVLNLAAMTLGSAWIATRAWQGLADGIDAVRTVLRSAAAFARGRGTPTRTGRAAGRKVPPPALPAEPTPDPAPVPAASPAVVLPAPIIIREGPDRPEPQRDIAPFDPLAGAMEALGPPDATVRPASGTTGSPRGQAIASHAPDDDSAESASAEIDGRVIDFEGLRAIPPSPSEPALLQQLSDLAARSNLVESWPGIHLMAVDLPTPANRIFAAGDACVVVLVADRPSVDLAAWGAALADWLADQLTEVAGDDTFSDAFNPHPPTAVLAVREPDAGAVSASQVRVVPIARLPDFFAEFGRTSGPLHPTLRDLLDDVFGYA